MKEDWNGLIPRYIHSRLSTLTSMKMNLLAVHVNKIGLEIATTFKNVISKINRHVQVFYYYFLRFCSALWLK